METDSLTLTADSVQTDVAFVLPFEVSADSVVQQQGVVLPYTSIEVDSLIWGGNSLTTYKLQAKFTSSEDVATPTSGLNSMLPHKTQESWPFFVLLISMLVLAWGRVSYPKRLNQMITSFFSNRFVGQMLREEQVFTSGVNISLTLIYVISLSLLLSFAVGFYNLNFFTGNSLLIFLKSLAAISVFSLLKNSLLVFSNFLFKQEQTFTAYLFNIFLFNNVAGLILLPIVTLTYYSHLFDPAVYMWIAGAVLTLTFLLRVIKSLIMGANEARVPVFYIFLYICTLEISPVLVGVRLFLDYAA